MKIFFPTFIEQKKLRISPAIHAELKKTSLKLPLLDEVGQKWSKKNYPNGYTSYGSLSKLHREALAFVKKVGLKFPHGKLELSSLWLNMMPKNCYHAFHLHPNSVVSGTYYLSLPKGASPLRVEDPRTAFFMATPPRLIQFDLRPKEGEVVLFESWLKHEVPPHQSSQSRLSVSFNYDWVE